MSSCSQQTMEADSETLQNVSAQLSFNPQSTPVGVEKYVSVLEILQKYFLIQKVRSVHYQ